jgi:hypothetical protein
VLFKISKKKQTLAQKKHKLFQTKPDLKKLNLQKLQICQLTKQLRRQVAQFVAKQDSLRQFKLYKTPVWLYKPRNVFISYLTKCSAIQGRQTSPDVVS